MAVRWSAFAPIHDPERFAMGLRSTLVFALALAACGEPSGDSDPAVQRDTLPNGAVVVTNPFQLHAFDGEGRPVRSIGGSGDGPGEFGYNPCAHDDEYASLRVQAITESHIFGVVRDDFDVDYVVRLAIQKPSETP